MVLRGRMVLRAETLRLDDWEKGLAIWFALLV